MAEVSEIGKVVFFDGECGLCDRFVQNLIKIDRAHVLRFATLQGETARQLFGPMEGNPESWSVRYTDENGTYLRSEAALRSIAAIGGGWKLFLGLLIFPRWLRDGVYRIIARFRYRLFGKFAQCLLPTPTLRERFLP